MNKAKRVSRFLVEGISQCYPCKLGLTCADGNIVKDHGFVDKFTPDMQPPEFDNQPNAQVKCEKAARLLNDILSKAKF